MAKTGWVEIIQYVERENRAKKIEKLRLEWGPEGVLVILWYFYGSVGLALLVTIIDIHCWRRFLTWDNSWSSLFLLFLLINMFM